MFKIFILILMILNAYVLCGELLSAAIFFAGSPVGHMSSAMLAVEIILPPHRTT